MTFRRWTGTVAAVVGLASVGFAASARAADVPTHVVAANVNDAGIDPSRGSQPRLARGRPGPAGREAARVHGRRGRDQPARRTGARSAARADASATTRSSSRTQRGAGRGAAAGRLREQRRSAGLAAELRVQRAHGDPRRARGIDRRQRRSGEQHREPADQGAPAPRATYPGEGWAQFLDGGDPRQVVGDRDRRPVARRRPGRADRDAALGVPRGGVRRLGGRQARLGQARADALEPALHAQPPARGPVRADVLRVRRVRPGPGCPLAAYTLVENRQPPFGTRQLVHNLEPATLDGVVDPYQTSTTRDGWIAARGRRHAVAQADQRLALDPR